MSIPNLKLAKAENAVMSHDWKTAARLYKELLVGNESNVNYLKALASIYVKSGEDEKAIPYYEQIINFYPHDVDAMNNLGAIYRRLKRYEDSIRVLQRALEERVNIGMVNYNLGFTYKEMGNYEDAIESFELVIAENPGDVLAYNHLGSIFFATKEYHKSIMTFKKGLQVDPNHPILNYNLARCYEATNSAPEAIRCYEAALKTRPGWIDAIRDYSEFLINCQETAHAQEIVEQSIKLHPLDTDLLSILGKIYLHENDYDKSISAYKKAEDLKGNDAKILTGYAKALEKASRVDQALDKVEQAVDLEPNNKDVRKQYAHTLLSAQRYDQALDNINELYNDKGDKDLQLLDLYGQYFICRGNEEVAKFYYDKIKKLNKHYKDFMLEAADRFMQTGDYESAEKYAKDYIESRPQRPDGYTHLGKVYNALGKLKDAQDQFEKSVALKKPNIFANKEIKRIQDEISKNPEKYNPAPIVEESPVEEQEPVEEVKEEPEQIPENIDEDFDFTQLGDDVATKELLNKDEEEDFWNTFDDDEMESSNQTLEDTLVEDDESLAEEEDEPDQEEDTTPYFDLGDAGYLPKNESPLDRNLNDDIFGEDGLKDVEDLVPPEKMSMPEEKPAFGDKKEPVMPEMPELSEMAAPIPEQEPEPVPAPMAPSMPEPASDDFIPPALEHELERGKKAQEALSDHAMEAAFNAQKMAQELAEKQQQLEEQLRKENEEMIREAVEKTIDDRMEAAAEYKEEFEDTPSESELSMEDNDEIVIDDSEIEQLNNILGLDEDDGEVNMIDEEDPIYVVNNDDGINVEQASDYLNDPIGESLDERLKELGQAADADDILEKIEKILSDPEIALEYKEQIQLFKTLRILSKFLPESERNSFLTCKMRVLIEYIISKMSGKPGLLLTAESLLKSGVLGPEYEKHIFDYDPEPLSNNLVKEVLQMMKDMAENLEDKELANALHVNIDSILEQIELNNQDIF